jgi:putative tryptophan/tyrosine transport system substrate-binding protein
MRRREFIAGLGSAAAWPMVAHAQQPALPVIGYLSSTAQDDDPRYAAAFHSGLAETGFVKDRNMIIEYRRADGEYARLPALAAELVRREVKVIGAFPYPAAVAAKAATSTIPIVFISGPDPVKYGLVTSLNRPSGNLTGVTTMTSELGPKRLQILRELLPATMGIAMLVNPDNPRAEADIESMRRAAGELGQRLVVAKAAKEREIEMAFEEAHERAVGAVLVSADPFFFSQNDRLVALARRHMVPTISFEHSFAAAGGLITYGTTAITGYREVGNYIGRILKGAKVSDLPVQQATNIELVINLRTAKALGLTVPQSILLRADEVIE